MHVGTSIASADVDTFESGFHREELEVLPMEVDLHMDVVGDDDDELPEGAWGVD